MSLTPGQQISTYRVVGTLGVGGMGEVYRARDTRLDRDVAIKVLPAGWDDDQDHARRFEREAKTLAALNHSNISQVYGFEELEGQRLLILELVEGEELADRIARGTLPADETRELCRQIAEGLEVAHEQGVVHRDLKPANVRITPAGVAKLLDFGLAKSVVRESSTETATDITVGGAYQTQAGVLVGTPTYMSPERVRGMPDDRRGDIWAFGCVLYECLTGKPAFDGDTLPDTLARIVEHEPDLSRLPQRTPPALRELIERCLDKDPRTRLRDIGEARVVLERPLAATAAAPAPPGASRRRRFGIAAVALAFLAGAIAMFLVKGAMSTSAPTNPLENVVITKLTDDAWSEFGATISRDGRHVAFAADREGQYDVWLRLLDTWDDINLTKGTRGWWSLKVRDIEFNRNSTRVIMTRRQGACSVNFRGEDLKDHFRERVVNSTWSPDEKRVVYQTSHPGDPLYLANADGSNPEELLPHGPGLHQHYPIWSPYDGWVYLVRGRPTTLEMELWRVRPEPGAEPERLTTGMVDVTYPTPIGEDTVLFLAHEPNGAGPWLWVLDVESGLPPRRVFWGAEKYTSLAASQDGRTLVATVARRRASLWRVPIRAEGTATEDDIEPIHGLDEVPALAPRFAGEDLYFISSRRAGDGLWSLRAEGPLPILDDEGIAVLAPPAVSPDGKSLAVVLRKEGRVGLWTAGADGGLHEELSDTVQVYGSPSWSPDGQWIAVGGVDAAGAPALYRFASAGGPPERLVEGFAANPEWSPKGDLLVYSGKSVMAFLPVQALNPETREAVELPEMKVTRIGERYRFLPDGSGLVVSLGLGAREDLYLLDLQTMKEPHRLTRFADSAEMRTFDVDPTGKYIVFDRTEQNSDVVLIER